MFPSHRPLLVLVKFVGSVTYHFAHGTKFGFGSRHIEPFVRELPSLLEEFFQPANGESRGTSFPLDIEETENAYRLTADLPGLEKSDIGVDLNENTLTISAERKDERDTDGRVLWREREIS